MRQVVCKSDELKPGQMIMTNVGRIPVVVTRSPDGSLSALANTCLHLGGPLGKGRLCGTTDADEPAQYRYVRDGEILKCPWHGFEYDTKSGCLLAEPERRLRTFLVTVEGDKVIVHT